MSWKDDFKPHFDLRYKWIKKQYPNIRFPCYGGIFHVFLFRLNFIKSFLYLTENSLIYILYGTDITEIPFADIKKLSVKQRLLFKRSFHIKLSADKKYHFIVYNIKNFSTELTGDADSNVRGFLNTLQSSVKNK